MMWRLRCWGRQREAAGERCGADGCPGRSVRWSALENSVQSAYSGGRRFQGFVTGCNVGPGCGQDAIAATGHTTLSKDDIRALPGFVPCECHGVAAFSIQFLGEKPGAGEGQ